MESDGGSGWYIFVFQNCLTAKNVHHYSGFTDKSLSIAERVIRTIHILLRKPIFEKRNADWFSELPSAIQKYNNAIHNSIKMTPIQGRNKANEKLVYSNLKDNRRVQKPKFRLGQLVRNLSKKFSAKVIAQTIAISFIQ